MRVALFITCLADQFYAEAGVAAVRLLRALGVEVDFPQGQTCCGQPAYTSGFPDEARKVGLVGAGTRQPGQPVLPVAQRPMDLLHAGGVVGAHVE